jgi:lipase chaperone LimK
MIGDSLTEKNLKKIYKAMAKIDPIDQSEYFIQYQKEIVQRLIELNFQKNAKNK